MFFPMTQDSVHYTTFAHLDKKPRFGHIFTGFKTTVTFNVVSVAQLVRAPVCGTGSRGFNPHHSPARYLRP